MAIKFSDIVPTNLLKPEFNTSGIYKITNLVNNDFYIGSAVNFRKRFNTHKHFLSKGKRCNKYLYNAINKYGIENFLIEIIEVVNKENILNREQYYIDSLNPKYNICKIAGNTLGLKMSDEFKENQRQRMIGSKHTEETKRKIGDAHRGIPRPEYIREKLKTINIGRKHTDEAKKKFSGENSSNAKLKNIEVVDIKTMIRDGISGKEICQKYNIDYSNLSHIKAGRIWKNIKID